MFCLQVRVCQARGLPAPPAHAAYHVRIAIEPFNQLEQLTRRAPAAAAVEWDSVLAFNGITHTQGPTINIVLMATHAGTDGAQEQVGNYQMALSTLKVGAVEDEWILLKHSTGMAEVRIRMKLSEQGTVTGTVVPNSQTVAPTAGIPVGDGSRALPADIEQVDNTLVHAVCVGPAAPVKVMSTDTVATSGVASKASDSLPVMSAEVVGGLGMTAWKARGLSHVAARGTDGKCWCRTITDGVCGHWAQLGGDANSGYEIAAGMDGSISIFYRGHDDALWYRAFAGSDYDPRYTSASGGWSEWQCLGGKLTSGVGAVSWAPGHLAVFARGTDNACWHKIRDDKTGWTEWQSLGGICASGIAACSWAPGRLDIFTVGTDATVYHKHYVDNKWSDWTSMGGVAFSTPTATCWGPGRIDLCVVGTSQRLYHKRWDKKCWSPWEDLGGFCTSAPAMASPAANVLDVVVSGSDKGPYLKRWETDHWTEYSRVDGELS